MSDAVSSRPEPEEKDRRPAPRFLHNVLWSWFGVAVQLLPGFVVTPYMIFKLGTEQYGIWSLVFSVVGYYALVDLGFRSAAVRYTAHFYATGESQKLNELVNTLFLYFSIVSLALVAFTLVVWQKADRFFQVRPEYHYVFAWLVLLAGINLSVGVVGGVFSGCVEGVHRFDISNRIFIITFGARSVGWLAMLKLGKGLVALGAWALVTNTALVLLYARAVYRILPSVQLSPKSATKRMFRETASYGLHTFMAGMATRAMEQITPVLIGHYRPMTEVGYYNFPLRLLQYGTDAVSRIGIVATPKSADMAARRHLDQVARLAVLASRYSLVLFMPIALFLGNYGLELLMVWLRKPDLAVNSAALIPVMLVAFTLAQAAQFCASSVLFGLGAQRGYAITLVVELILNVVATVLVLPRYGIYGAAVVTSVLMLVSRGIVTPWLLCRHLSLSFAKYMLGVLGRPLTIAAPFWIGLTVLHHTVIPGNNLRQLAAVGMVTTAGYFAGCYFLCLEPEHRDTVKGWVLGMLRRARHASAAGNES
jgi:O-antigen/teichoic acid export membrane protein